MRIGRDSLRTELLAKIEEISGEALAPCYQCGKCSAGCPLEKEMGILPHQVIRFLQLGWEKTAVDARAIWLCAACHTCAARCPRGVDLSRVMEALRVVLLRRGGRPDLAPPPAEAPQQALVAFSRKYSG
ncbi:MAG TPA: heterodisulfide reductase [Clostridiales bacterium UBA8153]|jgi:heterodisulfide reductase subunit C|nr:heterodisulfide reductase [Clostridiales bacterium UBA8153]